MKGVEGYSVGWNDDDKASPAYVIGVVIANRPNDLDDCFFPQRPIARNTDTALHT
jgi:hypothetical protein